MSDPTPPEITEAYNAYAQALGSVVHGSNVLQESLSRLYWHIAGGKLDISNAVWHSIISDRTQRDILKAALNGCREHIWEKRLPKAREDLNWLITETNKLANQRNDAVHAPCVFSFGDNEAEVVAVPNTLNQRAINLRNKKLIKEFELYSAAYAKLNWFLLWATQALHDHQSTWPDRPLLPTRDQSHFRDKPLR